jgi:PAS domain S-box-containing protein
VLFRSRTGTTLWSPGVYRLLGRDDVEPSRSVLLDAIHPADLSRVEAAVQAAQESGDVFDVEYRITRPDGSVRWIHDRAEYWRDSQGKPIRAFGVLQDVTDLRSLRGSAELRDEELAVALEAGGVVLWRYDPASASLTYPKRSQTEQAPLIPAPSTLSRLRQVVHSDDLSDLEAAVNGLIGGERAQIALTYRVRGLDGSWRRVLSRGRRYIAEDTGTTTVIGATVDITDPDPPPSRGE